VPLVALGIATGVGADKLIGAGEAAKQDVMPAVNLSDQEKEIDVLTAKVKKLMDEDFKARSKYDDFLANISD